MPPPGPERRVYLDHAAATPLSEAVAEAMQQATAAFANPASPHAAGRAARRILEDARERILSLLGGRTTGVDRDRLVFTSGSTEANRLAILGLAKAAGGDAATQGWIAVSARDHSSIHHPARELAGLGWRLCLAPLGPRGSFDHDALVASADECAADGQGRIMAVTTVCGHSGIRADSAGVEAIATRLPGLLVHADATQAAGWDEVVFHASPWATLTLAPHKFGGPRGVGGLVVRGGVPLVATMPGSQELGLRGGTEAVHLAAGFARALEVAAADRAGCVARIAALRHRLEAGLLSAARQAGLEPLVVGGEEARAPHVTLLALAGVDRQVAALAADMEGICLATGTACASGSTEPPAILAALGVPERFRDGGLRLSLGRTSTAADVDDAISRLAGVFARLTPSLPGPG